MDDGALADVNKAEAATAKKLELTKPKQLVLSDIRTINSLVE